MDLADVTDDMRLVVVVVHGRGVGGACRVIVISAYFLSF